ncbi:uncharacterized protein [Lepeophtheirus salmonis]|uniref:uncharacterized protein isoform X2 n=1 Tax=Lepeophtheirus salmonis TaxID=72036 RepID=UPI001AE7D580|nr:macrophage mannose receptor 1-like isoform X2 [Lepeophtheirus salmonis]
MKGPVEHCFNIPETDYYNIKFDHANMECENLQGVLAGIHSPSDNQWLLKNIPINKRNEEHWFGAYKAGVETESSFHWMDLEPSLGGYVNWNSSSRNNMKGYGVFNGTSGKWRLISDYTQIRSFLCSARKVVPTSPPKPSTTTTITTLDPSDDNSNTKLQAGGIAGIVIGIILGMVLVIGVIYVALRPNFSNVPLLFRRSSPKLQKNNAFDNMTYSSSSGSVATSISENMTNE